MSEKKRGYSMPLTTNKKQDRFVLILLTALLLVQAVIVAVSHVPSGDWFLLALFVVVFGGLTLGLWICFLAQVHFVPEGVALTVFGITLRRFPAEKIRLITGAYSVYKGTVHRDIALCDYSLEELTDYAIRKKPKMFRNAREFRPGEWADDYLSSRNAFGPLLNRRILMIPWTAERLQALRALYPDARWVDVTKDKYFDKQMEDFSSETTR